MQFVKNSVLTNNEFVMQSRAQVQASCVHHFIQRKLNQMCAHMERKNNITFYRMRVSEFFFKLFTIIEQ